MITTTIAVPEAHLPRLRETAAREVSLIADDLIHAEYDGEVIHAIIDRIEAAIATYRDVMSGSPLSPATVKLLADAQISWECGDSDVRMPDTVAEADDLAARVERQRFLIAVRDHLATA